MTAFPWLTVTGAIPLAGALVIAAVPAAGSEPAQRARDLLARRLALGFSLATLALAVAMMARFDPGGPDF